MHIERLLIPVRGNHSDKQAMELASTIIAPGIGRVYALYVIEVPRQFPVDADLSEETFIGEKALNEIEEFFQKLKIPVTAEFLQARDLGPAVLKEVEERKIELVLLSTRYEAKHGAFNLGSEIPYLLENTPCPIWVLRDAIFSNPQHDF